MSRLKEVSAVIMAAGKGKRMEELTEGKIPKPMLLVDGQAVVERVYDNLIKAGVDEIVLVIAETDLYTGNMLRTNTRIVSQRVDIFPGTAKAAETGLRFVPYTPNRRVIVLNGDDSFLLDPRTIMDFVFDHEKKGRDCSLMVRPTIKGSNQRERYLGEGDIVWDKNWEAKYIGVLIARYGWLDHFLPLVRREEGGEYKITQLFGLARQNSIIEQVLLSDEGQWNDFNRPSDLIMAESKLR